MSNKLEKDLKKLLEIILVEGIMPPADIREMDIDKKIFKELNIALQALFISSKNYSEQKEIEYHIKDNDDLFEYARKKNYCLEEMDKALIFMEIIILIIKKCSVYENYGVCNG